MENDGFGQIVSRLNFILKLLMFSIIAIIVAIIYFFRQFVDLKCEFEELQQKVMRIEWSITEAE